MITTDQQTTINNFTKLISDTNDALEQQAQAYNGQIMELQATIAAEPQRTALAIDAAIIDAVERERASLRTNIMAEFQNQIDTLTSERDAARARFDALNAKIDQDQATA
jgi:DNA repair exonuclease SbcCD ATPase subunit